MIEFLASSKSKNSRKKKKKKNWTIEERRLVRNLGPESIGRI